MNYVFTGLLSFAFLLSAGAGGYRQYTYRFGDHFPPTTFEGNVVHLLDGEKARNQISKGEPMTTPSGERIPAAAARYAVLTYYYATSATAEEIAASGKFFAYQQISYQKGGKHIRQASGLIRAREKILPNCWATATFNTEKLTKFDPSGEAVLRHFQLFAFFRKHLNAGEKLYLKELVFTSFDPAKPTESRQKVTIFSRPGEKEPLSVREYRSSVAAAADKIPLPPAPQGNPEQSFLGWKNENDGKIYRPGTAYPFVDGKDTVFTGVWRRRLVHVSASGSDTDGDGSADRPFATLRAALAGVTDDGTGVVELHGTVDYRDIPDHTNPVTCTGNGTLRWSATQNRLKGPLVLRGVQVETEDSRGFFSAARPLSLEQVICRSLSLGGDLSVKGRPEHLRLKKGKIDTLYLGGDTAHPRLGALTGENTVELEASEIGTLYLGNSTRNDQLFAGNINLRLRDSRIQHLTDQQRKIGWITGGVQILCEGNSSIGRMELKQEPGMGRWLLHAPVANGALAFTSQPGRFQLADGKYALARRKEDGKLFSSIGRELQLPAGSYEITFPEQPLFSLSADRKTLKAVAAFPVDFQTIPAPEQPGKLFLGWADASGKGVANGTRLAPGQELQAVFCNYLPQNDLTLLDVEPVDAPAPQLRFRLRKSAALPPGESGVIVLPKLYTRHRELLLGGSYQYPWEKGKSFLAEQLRHSDGVYSLIIPEAVHFNRVYAVRGFHAFTALNGFRRVLYTPERRTSVIQQLPRRRAEAREACFRAGTTPIALRQEEGNGGEKAYVVNSNGLTLLEITLDSGKKFDRPVEIITWGDNHFKAINDTDRNNVEIMYANRRRGRANPIDRATQSAQTLMEFAPFFDQSVVLGDNIDFFCHGGLEVWRDLILSGDPKLLAAVGYHDYVTYTISGRPRDEFDINAARKYIEKFYRNDTVYTSAPVAGKVLAVVLDNSRNGQYYKEDKIAEKLAADIARARKEGWIILIFQHESLYLNTYPRTKDGSYDAAKDAELCTRHGFLLDEHHRNKVIHYTRSGSFFNGRENNAFSQVQGTKAVYRLITENADIIRGVFHGHVHACYASKIQARNADGSPAFIPQYSVHGSVFYDHGFAIRIIVR